MGSNVEYSQNALNSVEDCYQATDPNLRQTLRFRGVANSNPRGLAGSGSWKSCWKRSCNSDVRKGPWTVKRTEILHWIPKLRKTSSLTKSLPLNYYSTNRNWPLKGRVMDYKKVFLIAWNRVNFNATLCCQLNQTASYSFKPRPFLMEVPHDLHSNSFIDIKSRFHWNSLPTTVLNLSIDRIAIRWASRSPYIQGIAQRTIHTSSME